MRRLSIVSVASAHLGMGAVGAEKAKSSTVDWYAQHPVLGSQISLSNTTNQPYLSFGSVSASSTPHHSSFPPLTALIRPALTCSKMTKKSRCLLPGKDIYVRFRFSYKHA